MVVAGVGVVVEVGPERVVEDVVPEWLVVVD